MFWSLCSKNLLKKQRVKRRMSAARRRLWLIVVSAGFTCCVGFVLFSVHLRYQAENAHWRQTSYKNLPPQAMADNLATDTQKDPWRISIVDRHGMTPQKPIALNIIQASKTRLIDGSRDELQRLSRYILRESLFDHVSITRIAPRHVLIRVNIPEAVAIIKAGHNRLVSKYGQIFGKAQPDQHPLLTRITGVFSKTSYNATQDNKIHIQSDTKRVISRILQTLSIAKSSQISIKTLHHDPYLGFNLQLTSGVHVALGHPPYETKIKRLANIIENAKQHGTLLEKVELDFKGKAFVQKVQKAKNDSASSSEAIPSTSLIP